MAERKWMPHEYQDEVVPPARPTPDNWIIRTADGAPALAGGDCYGAEDEPGRPLQEGESVLFDWTESYGTRRLTFRLDEDEEWQWELDGDEPASSPDADLMVAETGDWETMMPSLSEFASEYDDKVNGETIMITFYGWSSGPTEFVFRDDAFHELEIVN